MSVVQTRARARQHLSLKRWLRPEKVKATSHYRANNSKAVMWWIEAEVMRASHLCAAVDGYKLWESSRITKAKTQRIKHRMLRKKKWCLWPDSKWRWASAVVTHMESPGSVSMHLVNCWSREDFEVQRAPFICDTTFLEKILIQKSAVDCK